MSPKTEISIHNSTPCKMGLKPVERSVFEDNPDPIRKRVSVKPDFEAITMKGLSSDSCGTKVFSKMARMKNTMKYGIFIPDPFEPYIRELIRVMGIIHSALVSLTVVAVCSDSVPYRAAAPTTELVS